MRATAESGPAWAASIPAPPNETDANRYRDTVLALLTYTFGPHLQYFRVEQDIAQGLGRIDIVATNRAESGAFAMFRERYHADFIPIECKNYSADLANEEFNQLASRLGSSTSGLGMLVCRTITDAAAMQRHQVFRWAKGIMLLLFDDEVLTRLVRLKMAGRDADIDGILLEMTERIKFDSVT